MHLAIRNIGTILSGSLEKPVLDGDTVVCADGRIAAVGSPPEHALKDCDMVIDAAGAVLAPGFVDSHVHITFGDYTPRQQTVGYLESYLHGGTTTSISASEVHVPGRPRDPAGVKALAVAAHKSFIGYRPGGMTVHAGSLIIEPGLAPEDFHEVARQGVWLAKAGFGAFPSAYEYKPMIEAARAAGMITTVHTGGSSIPGSGAITGEHLLELDPHVSFHINGGPTAMPDAHFEMIVRESGIALQVCTAGNLRTTLLCAELAARHDALARLLVATDTPTGSGVMPLGMLYTMSHLASLGPLTPEQAICAATGNPARIYGLDCGEIAVGRAADLVLLDAPDGGTQTEALSALKHGDIPAVAGVVSRGELRFVGRSRNTPAPVRRVEVASCSLPHPLASGH